MVYTIRNKNQYILKDVEGKILNGIFHFNRPKQTFLRTNTGPVNTQAEFKQIINLGVRISEPK